MKDIIQRILPLVQKPARYIGGEFNQIIKPLDKVDIRVAFCFPDTYEIGMSNVGMRILYGVMNQMDGVWCERVFAPWADMEAEMRKHNLPLWALESQDTIDQFDMLAFTIGYEMSYSNILNMLALGKIPLKSKDRPSSFPGREALGRGNWVGDADEIGKEIAKGFRNSSKHWAYVGSADYSYMAVGVRYSASATGGYHWTVCVFVTDTNEYG